MEIEAKFAVTDETVLQRLGKVPQLSTFTLGSADRHTVRDRYLDTQDRALLHAGYFCRLRSKQGRIVVTVKGAGQVQDGLHERPEYEVTLEHEGPPQSWPPSEARDLVLRLSQGKPLEQLFAQEQVRNVRDVLKDGQKIAEMSLDQVQVELPGGRTPYYEVEVELMPGGSIEDLREIAHILHNEWHLAPENRSKFERALVLLESGDTTREQ